MQMIVLQYIWKVSYEVILTPVTYHIVGWIKQKEGIDTFDDKVKYNPFSLEV
ncbi:VUT family protein [Desulfosporosinus acididurans]|uniref:VUT family protein n=1 Tax=Desulfosporosinus acididurans TaxID=476652 RepID=UPI00137928E0|nr:VUT family protein [Desulfosporosinus acididurans]